MEAAPATTNSFIVLGKALKLMVNTIQMLLEWNVVQECSAKFVRCCTFSILTPIHAQRSSIRALTYTTQVRSGGSQVFVGYRNHRAEPVAVLRRAPTLTDEQRQQRVGSKALPPSELWPQSAKEGVRESQGLDRPRSCLLSPGKLNTGLTLFHTAEPLELCKRCTWLHVASIRMSPWMTDDDPLTK